MSGTCSIVETLSEILPKILIMTLAKRSVAIPVLSRVLAIDLPLLIKRVVEVLKKKAGKLTSKRAAWSKPTKKLIKRKVEKLRAK